jgi:hypothetical protein
MSEVRKMSKADTVEAMRGIIADQKGSVLAEYRGLLDFPNSRSTLSDRPPSASR